MPHMLKRYFAVLFCLLSALPAFPQARAGNPVTTSFLAVQRNVQQNLIEAAEAMPEEHYTFRPTPEVRQFGEWVEHTAMSNYNYCSALKGEANPHAGHAMKITGKPDLVKFFKESFDYCAPVLKSLDDQKALAETKMGNNTVPRVRPMFQWVASLNSHYGSMAVYLRLKNVVPPSTARAQKAQKK